MDNKVIEGEFKVIEETPKTATERLEEAEKLLAGVVKDLVEVVAKVNNMESVFGESLVTLTKELTAVKNQRLTGLENVQRELVQYIQGIERVFRDGKTVSKETMKEALVANMVDGMKAQIDMLLARKVIQAAEVTKGDSLVVFQELDVEGKIINPRGQLGVDTLDKETQAKFVDKKVGDLISVVPERTIQVLEIYELAKAPEAGKVEFPTEVPGAPSVETVPPVEEPKCCGKCSEEPSDCCAPCAAVEETKDETK